MKVYPEKDETGKPMTGPRNFYTNKKIQGKTPDAQLFGKPTYISIGDPFKSAAKKILEKPETAVDHDLKFKPYGNEKRKVPKKYPVQWMQESQDLPDVKRFRDPDGGHVVTQLPNVLTGPGKKGKVGRK